MATVTAYSKAQTDTLLAGKDAAGAATAAQAAAVQRGNHTGTQTADTITDGTTNKAFLATERTKLAGIATAATANRTDAATDTAITTAINNLVNGAPGALDTLAEIATQLGNDETAATALTGLANARAITSTVTLTAAGALTGSARNTLDGTSGSFTATLPAPAKVGQLLLVDRVDASTTTTITVAAAAGATIRGNASATFTLPGVGVAGEGSLLVAESLTSWTVAGSIKPKAWLDALYGGKTAVTVDGAPVATLDISSAALVPSTPSMADTFALAAVNYDPLSASATTAENTGVGYLARIHLDKAATISNVLYAVGTAITGATTGNLIGLYDDNGVQQAVTGDQSAAWASTGLKTTPFGTPVALQPGWYYLMLITNGTTGVGLYRAGSTGIQNIGLDGTATKRYRFGTYGTGQTTLPASLTMASIATGTTLLTLWFGLS